MNRTGEVASNPNRFSLVVTKQTVHNALHPTRIQRRDNRVAGAQVDSSNVVHLDTTEFRELTSDVEGTFVIRRSSIKADSVDVASDGGLDYRLGGIRRGE